MHLLFLRHRTSQNIQFLPIVHTALIFKARRNCIWEKVWNLLFTYFFKVASLDIEEIECTFYELMGYYMRELRVSKVTKTSFNWLWVNKICLKCILLPNGVSAEDAEKWCNCVRVIAYATLKVRFSPGKCEKLVWWAADGSLKDLHQLWIDFMCRFS